MSKQQVVMIQTDSKTQLKMDFNVDLSMFCQNIRSNFGTLWDLINRHNDQIQIMKNQIYAHDKMLRLKQNQFELGSGQERKMSKNFQLNYSQITAQQDNSNPQARKQNQKNISENIQKAQQKFLEKQSTKVTPQVQQKTLSQEMIQNIKNVQQINTKTPPQPKRKPQSQQNSIKLEQQQQAQEAPQQPQASELLNLVPQKILNLTDRLDKLQLASVKQSSNYSKKMNQLYNQLQKNNEVLQKRENQMKKLEHLIDKLRGQLSQYKLKKQAQLMKMSVMGQSSPGGSGSNSQIYEFLVDKIQEVSNTIPELFLREQFDEFKVDLKRQIGRLEKKVEGCVRSQEFDGVVGVLGRKMSNTNSKLITTSNKNKKNAQQHQNKQQEQQIEQNTITQVQLKLFSIQSTISSIQTKLSTYESSVNFQNQATSQKLSNISSNIHKLQSSFEHSKQKSMQYEQFMKNMNQLYNQKIKQIVSQIVENQEAIDKLEKVIKIGNFVNSNKQEGYGDTKQAKEQKEGKNERVVDLQNQLSNLKKKVNKILLKMQTAKQDMLTVRQDFSRQYDGLKIALQKKSDWQSLKKSIHYFQQRTKQITSYIQQLQKNLKYPQQSQSTAAKRGWTCLCCDKDIKQYQGKVGDVKFTSIFPSRYQSPRIGGYYKQKQMDKEYKQVFLKHNRRLSREHIGNGNQMNYTKSKQEIL